jgi:DNA repair protein RecN (Recombination protein N)
MLYELSVKNLAIIKDIRISLQKGLTIITGETGAGKSILIDALGFLTGARGASDYVRYGEKKAEIEGLFEVKAGHPLHSLLEQLGIDPPEDELLIVRREITAQGKSICRVNGQLVTLSTLKEIGPWLIHIHGQHDHQSLMNADRHLEMLDAYGGQEIAVGKSEYRKIYNEYKTVRAEYIQFAKSEQQLAQRQDMLSFQLQEITEADLTPYEDEELAKEKNKLIHAERLFKGIEDACLALSGEQASLDWVGLALSHLESVSALDENIGETVTQLESAFYLLEETARSLKNYRGQLEFEPYRLAEIEERLSEIHRLKRKYGKDVEEILEYAASIEDELDTILHREEKLAGLLQRLKELSQDLALEAVELSNRRQKAAISLAAEIENQLKDLHMTKTKFQVAIRAIEDIHGIEINGKRIKVTEDGIDEVEFMISPNPGEPLRPVAKIASGGELARIMLGIKTILSDTEPVNTFIFDEIDTGVSGKEAQAIAEKLRSVSIGKQVLCITHLPQTACMADFHFRISKTATETETKTGIQLLSEEDRINELARLMGGTEVTETMREYAREILFMAEESKHFCKL